MDHHRRTARRYRWPALGATLAIVLGGAAGCTLSGGEPYGDLPPAATAETVLEEINLATLGFRSYPCDLFDASVARCYRPDRWLSVEQGRETLVRVHRELVAAGARFWGGPDAAVKAERPVVAGLNLGCYFDYATTDGDLRVAIVGPTGEAAACIDGLPGDGVSEVWIIGGGFDPADVYSAVSVPSSLGALLASVPAPRHVIGQIYGGASSTVDGYYGARLPLRPEGAGVKLLPETVSVHDGVVRGLVQYRGTVSVPAPAPAPTAAGGPSTATPDATGAVGEAAGDGGSATPDAKTGVVGVVVGVGTSSYAVPILVRPGESAPFEITLPDGFTAEDLRVVPGWIGVDDTWHGAQLVSGPSIDPACAAGLTIKGEAIPGLAPGPGQSCFVAFAQATMAPETAIFADAMVAVFDEDGTVADVIQPYLIRGDGSLVAQGRLMTNDNDLRLAWVDSSGRDSSRVGVWIRYARGSDMVLGGAGDPAAVAQRATAATAAAAERDATKDPTG